MNQGRIWCVVSPSVGLPLLLGSVAVTSLIVHACVLTNTTWMSNYWQGSAKRTAENASGQTVASGSQAAKGVAITVAPVAGAPGKAESSFIVTVAPTQPADGGAQAAATSQLTAPGSGQMALATPPKK